MLEGLLLTAVLVYVFAYLIGKALVWFIEWEGRRENTPAHREELIEAMLSRQKRDRELEGTES